MRKRHFGILVPSLLLPILLAAQVYKDPSRSTEARVDDLLRRMTLEEKVMQLCSQYNTFTLDDVQDSDKMSAFVEHLPGQMQPQDIGMEYTIEARNKLQRWALEHSRLGIPLLFVDESLHGAALAEATSFPQAVALGCTWNPELVEQLFRTAAQELRSRGTGMVLSPVVDVAREPRWGRTEECYGEDPLLAGRMGAAAVRGLQGSSDGTIAADGVAATLKHFLAHGQKEGGRNKAPSNLSMSVLRDIHLESFRIAVRESHPRGVMPSYNEVDALPMHVNRPLMQDVLRGEFGFDGMMVSDYQGIKESHDLHHMTSGDKESALRSFLAGVEFDLPSGDCYKYLTELVREKQIQEKDIDAAVRKILRLKFELGLFENPYRDLATAQRISRRPESRALALRAAEESIVLLKNEHDLLPLKAAEAGKIAVIGPHADNARLGEYSGVPIQKISILEGMRRRFGDDRVVYAEGTRLTNNHSEDSRQTWFTPILPETFPQPEENRQRISEAVEVAREADLILLVLGENEMLAREAFVPESTGDNCTLELLGQQDELFDAMVATGKPVVVCLVHGRPLSINSVAEHADAILDLWYAGQETGDAVAAILTGDVNPSGKLTMTYPKSVGHLPVHYNRKPTSARNYVSDTFGWLWPFGHGLSYTRFDYSDAEMSASQMKADGSVTLSFTLTNSGQRDGCEVVQLYVRDEVASLTRPIKELKDFRKVFLRAGESKRVSFTIDRSMLEFWNIDRHYAVEPGEFTLMLGASSEDIRILTTLTCTN